MVTVPVYTKHLPDQGPREVGPIRLWDSETGALLASHFGPEDVFEGVWKARSVVDLLCIDQRASFDRNDHWHHLRLHDPITGVEIRRFECYVPNDNVWWKLSHDGQTTAFVTWEGSSPSVVVCDVRSGKKQCVLADYGKVIQFSPDGRRLAASREKEIVVFDIPSGREIARCVPPSGFQAPFSPEVFSPDGKLLLDNNCNVWDIDRGARRFSVPNIRFNASMFSPDGKCLIVVEPGDWLAYYDTATGMELPERRRCLSDIDAKMLLSSALPDGSRMIACGDSQIPTHGQLRSWLMKLPFVGGNGALLRFFEDKLIPTFVLMETETGREIARGNVRTWMCTPDGRYLLSDSYHVCELWDIPPRKPLRWLLPLIAAWSATFGVTVIFLTWSRRFRRHDADSDSTPAESDSCPACTK
jgi:WD40 repeat protein